MNLNFSANMAGFCRDSHIYTGIMLLALLQFCAYNARFYATPVNYASNNTQFNIKTWLKSDLSHASSCYNHFSDV